MISQDTFYFISISGVIISGVWALWRYWDKRITVSVNSVRDQFMVHSDADEKHFEKLERELSEVKKDVAIHSSKFDDLREMMAEIRNDVKKLLMGRHE